MRRTNLIASIALIFALVCLLGLTACQSQSSPLIGTWSISTTGQPTSAGPTWQFTQDGKLIQSAGGSAQNTTAKYSLSGNTLTLTTTLNGASTNSTMSVEWVSNDQFKGLITGMGSTPLTFTRKK
ncbi:MAG: hypothetical protein P4L93_06860 [Coriobacteriia bacterium]|nr:hypothetical protein [Coriobacteriia bacterium]